MNYYPTPLGTVETAEQINQKYNEYINESEGIRVVFFADKLLTVEEKIEAVRKAKLTGKIPNTETKEGIVISYDRNFLRSYILDLREDEKASDRGEDQ